MAICDVIVVGALHWSVGEGCFKELKVVQLEKNGGLFPVQTAGFHSCVMDSRFAGFRDGSCMMR